MSLFEGGIMTGLGINTHKGPPEHQDDDL